ncbi:MAG: hypothetical protein DRJ39_04235 [Thermoprotei archaeon]|nr:hypothetical protein [Thermoproteales archaeon]RLE73820.1 MAG: hypothetical protein DRJ44_08465 [Thermoprotei archaeon]RLE83802.1 MAG: hypothetical protein DRJ39_04235 [Thermoprotei archaeon]
MATLKQDNLSYAVLAVLISSSAAVIALGLPIENFLSEYYISKTFSWYFAWRVAVIELLLWFIGIIINTFEENFSKPLLLFTAVIFATAHYYKLLIISSYNNPSLGVSCRVSVFPFLYMLTCDFSRGFSATTYYLDMGQIILLVTFLILVPPKKLKAILKTFFQAL